jgi:hypothetical protein
MLLLIVTCEISYNIKILTLIPLYSSIKIKLVEVNLYRILKLQSIIITECGGSTKNYGFMDSSLT